MNEFRHDEMQAASLHQPNMLNPLTWFDAILGPINPVSRVLGGLSAIRHINYRRAARQGPAALAVEMAASAVGANAVQFGIPIHGKYHVDEVRRLLKRYGAPTFTLLHDHRNFYFSVKRSQARWAEYVMLQAGVELVNPPIDPRNAAYPNRHPPGWMPRPWSERESEAGGGGSERASALRASGQLHSPTSERLNVEEPSSGVIERGFNRVDMLLERIIQLFGGV